MKILITGIAGFIGSHCAERLHEIGHSVIGIDNFSDYYDVNLKRHNAKALEELGIKIIDRDLRLKHLENSLPLDIDYIFHFAAQPGLSKTSSFNDYLTNNVIATQNILDYAIHFNATKLFVNIATSSIYGLDATCNELKIPSPASYYGVTKLAAEQLVLSYSRLNMLKACSLRLYSVYGSREREDKMFNKLISCGLEDIKFPLYKHSLKHVRSFTHVRDAIEGIISVIGKEAVSNNEIFNIGTNLEHTTQEAIEAVEQELNVKIKFQHLPSRIGDQLRTKANIDKAAQILGYKPKISLKEGVKEQIDWYKNYLKDSLKPGEIKSFETLNYGDIRLLD